MCNQLCMFLCLSAYVSACLYVHLPLSLAIRLSICLSLCMSMGGHVSQTVQDLAKSLGTGGIPGLPSWLMVNKLFPKK